MLADEMEVKMMEEDATVMSKATKLSFKYYEESTTPTIGYSDTDDGGWTDYQEYWCNPIKISKVNIDRYLYGDLEEGDLLLMIPKDTILPKDVNEIKVYFNGRTYTTKTGLQEARFVGGTFLHYILIGVL